MIYSFYLVGNKIDRIDREVNYEEVMNFAKENNMKYFESSAKKDMELMNYLMKCIKIFMNYIKKIIKI